MICDAGQVSMLVLVRSERLNTELDKRVDQWLGDRLEEQRWRCILSLGLPSRAL